MIRFYLGELKRRKVFKVAVVYAVVAWLVVQIVDVLNDPLTLPGWFDTAVIVALAIGFPVALVLAWAFDLTPAGITSTGRAQAASRSEVRADKDPPVVAHDTQSMTENTHASNEEPDRDPLSIAVLPFDSLSADPDDSFLASGIHDDVLTQLAKIGELKVISRTSVMEYKNTKKKMRDIGNELGVAAILEGGVQRAGSSIHINAQLVDPVTDEHIWAESYDRGFSIENIFSIQSDIATAIAKALHTAISPEDAAHIEDVPTTNNRAYNFYLMGNDYFFDWRFYTCVEAVDMYEHAVEEDPQFALAFARLSQAHTQMYSVGADRNDSRLEKALSAAEDSLRLRPDSPEAHMAMASYYATAHRDYDRAWNALEAAERGLSGSSRAIRLRVDFLQAGERWQEALEASERLVQLDPRSTTAWDSRGGIFLNLRNYDQAEACFTRALELDPENSDTRVMKLNIPLFRDGDVTELKSAADLEDGAERMRHGWVAALYERDYEAALWYLKEYNELWPSAILRGPSEYTPTALHFGITYRLKGELELAKDHFRLALQQLQAQEDADQDDPRVLLSRARALAGLGEQDAALEIIHRCIREKLQPNTTMTRVIMVRTLVAAGDYDGAIEELDSYLGASGAWSIEGLLPDPLLDPIRDDPQFGALVEKYRRR